MPTSNQQQKQIFSNNNLHPSPKKIIYIKLFLFFGDTNLAAGPPGIIFAITTVGNIDPQPLSTITIPSGSFFAFGRIT
jgi:hypothetical protein